MMTSSEIETIARNVRKDVVRMHWRGSNIGSAMSAVDILAVLYFGIMNIPSANDPARDRFILSKGHAAAALYAILAQKGFIGPSSLKTFLDDGSVLAGHPCAKTVPGDALGG